MQCFHCGSKLDKSDIFCIRCGTPVLTEDDSALVNYSGSSQDNDTGQYSDTALFTDSSSLGDSSSFSVKPTVDESKWDPNSAKYINLSSSGSEEENVQEDDYFHEDEQWHPDIEPQEKGLSRIAVIIITIVACLALVGVGFYFLIRPSGVEHQRPGSTTIAGDNGDDTQSGDISDPSSPAQTEIINITVSSEGRMQTEFHAGVNETITLRAHIRPDSIDTAITWESSDPEVLEVVQLDDNGLEAQITGLIAGVADIILKAGDFEVNYIVYVDDLPLHVQLEHAIRSTYSAVWLTILWAGGPNADQETLFKRDSDTLLWVMESATGTSDISPVFGMVNNVFTIDLPTDDRTYNLFADSTGFYGDPESAESLDFIWWFMTYQIEPEG